MSADRNPYRLDKSDAKIMGVCAGLANYSGIDVTLIRIATVLLALCTSGFPVILAYIVIGLVAQQRHAA